MAIFENGFAAKAANSPNEEGYAPVVAAVSATTVASSIPVWTTEVGDMIFTVILVDVRGRRQYQLYGIHRQWVMVGLFGLYVDALAEIQAWQVFLAKGGSLRSWMLAHPDGIQPMLARS